MLGFIRCLGISLSKSRRKDEIIEFKELVGINIRELKNLEKICENLGYPKTELKSSKPSLATKSYTSFLLSQSYMRSKFETYGAILPCDWIFAEIGEKLIVTMPEKSESYHGIYEAWIESYASKEYQEDVKK